MMKFKVTLAGLALGLAVAIALSGPAPAAPSAKACQAKISADMKALEGQILAAYLACAGKMTSNTTNMAAAVIPCENALKGIYKGGGKVDVFRTKIEATLSKQCDGPSLSSLGFLLSGPGNPHSSGASVATLTENNLILNAEADAWKEAIATTPLFSNLLLQLQKGNDKTGAPVCPANVNVCKIKSECMERACNLGSPASSNSWTYTDAWALGTVFKGQLTNANILDMCKIDGALLNTNTVPDTDVIWISGNQGRDLGLVQLGSIYVCVDTLRHSGFCDCSAGGGKGLKDIEQCMDRDIFQACHKGIADTGTDACGSPCSAAQYDPNYPPDFNGLPKITAATPTAKGDCIDMITNQFTVVTATQVGGDAVPCTEDDDVVPNTPTTVVLTTGKSRSVLKNAVVAGGYGTCPAGDVDACVGACKNPCISGHCFQPPSAACSAAAPCPQNVCSGVTYDTPKYNYACSAGAADGLGCRPGQPADCPAPGVCARNNWFIGHKPAGGYPFPYNETDICSLYLQNHLGGMRWVGTFPGASDARSAGLGDDLSSFNQDCQ